MPVLAVSPQVGLREAAAKAAAAELAGLERQLGARKLEAQELQVPLSLHDSPPFFHCWLPLWEGSFPTHPCHGHVPTVGPGPAGKNFQNT